MLWNGEKQVPETLANFPKVRKALPPEFARIYEEHYKSNREGRTTASWLAQKAESWLHRQVASDVTGSGGRGVATLELGAGTLNQLDYEPGVAPYDVVEPFAGLLEGSAGLVRVRNVYADISEVPRDARYDRITSVAALEHICDLPRVVAISTRLLAPGGVFRASIPSEGGVLWKLGWMLTTGLEFRIRYGLDYGLLMAYEHVNTADEIEAVLRHFFSRVVCRVYGLSRSVSLYRYYECCDPRLDRGAEYTRE